MRSTPERSRKITALVGGLVLAGLLAGCAGADPVTSTQGRSQQAPHRASVRPVVQGGHAQRPNIVFVLADDLSDDLLRFMPHVRAMRGRGTSLSRYYVTNSLCCPSRASIMSGRYPHSTGVLGNSGPQGGYHVFHDTGGDRVTYATVLHRAGYHTGMIGKYLNRYEVDSHRLAPVGPGWSEWYVSGGGGYKEYDYATNENGRLVRHGHRPRDYGTDVMARQATSFIHRAARLHKPFALEVAPFSPHAPATPPHRYAHDFGNLKAPRDASFDQPNTSAPSWLTAHAAFRPSGISVIDRAYRKRARSSEAIDDLVARVQRELRASGVARNTYLVFSSDNGYHMGQHRLAPGKRTAFESDIHVPLVVTGPGVPAGRSVAGLAANIDIAPTFMRLGGAQVPARVEGRSLVPMLRGRSATSGRDALLLESSTLDPTPGDPDVQSRRGGLPPPYDAVRTGDEVYVAYRDGEREYYDLRLDPLERHNTVAGLDPDRRDELERRIEQLTACHDGRTCRAADAPAR